MTSNQILNPVTEPAWRIGFANMLRLENGRWWKTRRWWTNWIAWAVVMNLLTALSIAGQADRGPRVINSALELYFLFLNIFMSIAVVVLMQGAIVSEKQSGTAAWVLSKPVSRLAFIFSRTLGTWFAVAAIMIAGQGIVSYAFISILGGYSLDVLPFIAALVMTGLHITFYLTLTVLLGTVFDTRGPITGSALAVILGQQVLGGLLEQFAPWMLDILPGNLATEAGSIATGGTLLPEANFLMIVSTVVWCVLFLAMAVWRFRRQEF